MPTKEIVQILLDGNKRYLAEESNANVSRKRRIELIAKQEPHTIVLCCSDSRVVPEYIFDTGLGELYVVRVEGNVANIDSLASIEYALTHFHSKLIVVLGHQSCCAVSAAFVGGDNGYNLNHLLSHIIPAIAASPDGATVNDVAKRNAMLTVQDLLNRSPIIHKAQRDGNVEVIPAYYHLDSGKVQIL